MKKSVIGIGIAFMDIVIQSDFSHKNHSFYSQISHQIGGSILNIIVNCAGGGLIYRKGNDAFSNIVSSYLKEHNIEDYGIFVDKAMPVFTIINQKERYTSLSDEFEMNEHVLFDYSICNQYEYGITNSISATFINKLLESTTCKWIMNSYLLDNVNYDKVEGIILNREESSKYNITAEKLLEKLRQTNIRWAVITLDKDGCMYLEDKQIKYIKPNKTNLKSKIRTGDLFTATLIQQLINQQDLSSSIKTAMRTVEDFLLE